MNETLLRLRISRFDDEHCRVCCDLSIPSQIKYQVISAEVVDAAMVTLMSVGRSLWATLSNDGEF